jgi:uncharacterized protein
LKVRITAPPVDGAVNAELVKLLAKTFDVSKNEVEIIGGKTSKIKRVKILSTNAEKLREIIERVNKLAKRGR